MPQMIITTDAPDGRTIEVHRERIGPVDVETEAAGHRLVERIGWALSDADDLEQPADQLTATAPTHVPAG
jgi:hypothetical protein